MTDPTFSACGKQLLRDGEHWADCVGPVEAAALADLLNGGQFFLSYLPAARVDEIVKVLWG